MPLAATVYSNLYHKKLVTQFLISKVAERCLAGMTFCWKTNPEKNKHLCICLRKRQFVLWFTLFENRPTLLLQSIHIFLSMFGLIPASRLCWQQSKQSRWAKDVGQLHSAETSVAGKMGCFMFPCSMVWICPESLLPAECIQYNTSEETSWRHPDQILGPP